MSRPITWQNVNAPTSDPLQALALAQGSFKNVFSGLNDQIKQYENTSDANWKQVRDNNTQAFLSEINKYRTPEEYQAALASGALDASKYGAQIDQAAARTALDGRLAILQDRTVKANQFADQQQERDARPIVDRLNVMALSEDKDLRESAKKALSIYADQGMVPKAADLAGKIRDTEHQNTVWDREQVQADDAHTAAGSKLKVDAANIRHLNDTGAAALITANAAKARSELEAKLRASSTEGGTSAPKFSPEVANAYINTTAFSGGELGKPDGNKTVDEVLKAQGVEAGDASKIRRRLSEMPQRFSGKIVDPDTGKTVEVDFPIPAQLVAKHLGASYGSGFLGMGKGHYSGALEQLIQDDLERNALLYSKEYGAVQQVRGNSQYPALAGQAVRANAVRTIMDSVENPAVSAVDIAAGSKTGSKKKSK